MQRSYILGKKCVCFSILPGDFQRALFASFESRKQSKRHLGAYPVCQDNEDEVGGPSGARVVRLLPLLYV